MINQCINEARCTLKPEPVELHKVPGWLRLRICRKLGPVPREYTDSFSTLMWAFRKVLGDVPEWLDHYGTAKIFDKQVFVSEPYNIADETVKEIRAFAKALDIGWYLSPNSWWYPGFTYRIAFREINEA